MTPPVSEKLPADRQLRLDALLEKNSEGVITPQERSELEALVDESEKLMVANARRLAEFARQTVGTPTGAVPVTVWVKPEHAES